MTATATHDGADALGLPYAPAVVDQVGYGLVCPACGVVCRAEGSIGEATLEDDVTKGAAITYALHYQSAARAEAAA